MPRKGAELGLRPKSMQLLSSLSIFFRDVYMEAQQSILFLTRSTLRRKCFTREIDAEKAFDKLQRPFMNKQTNSK